MAEAVDYKKLQEIIVAKAKEKQLDSNLFFIMTYSDYKKKRVHIKELATKIDQQGVVVDGKANALLQEYDKAVLSAAALAEKLMNMLGEKQSKQPLMKDDAEDRSAKKMPDFEMLPPEKIKKWCKKFDIDPNDYSKKFLIRALEKRWNFEYGE